MNRFLLILIIFILGCSEKKEKQIVINTDDVSFRFDNEGKVISISSPVLNFTVPLNIYSNLKNCKRSSVLRFRMIPTGGVEFIKRYGRKGTHDSCTLLERFVPGEKSFIWQMEIEGDSGAIWSEGIQSIVELKDPDDFSFWAPWGSPEQLQPAENGNRADNTWMDPFSPRKFREMRLTYGGHCVLGAAYAVPMASVFSNRNDAGFSLLMSPYDPMLDVRMETTEDGKITQTRYYNRIGYGRKVVFTTHIYFHHADWRSAMVFPVDMYSEYFKPFYANAGEISGCGAYSSYEDDLNAEKYQKMGGMVNWKASFDFPFMGYFIPDVKNDREKWKRLDCNSAGEIIPDKTTYTSIRRMQEYFKKMNQWGFHTLAYFNITEFGAGIQYPKPEANATFSFPAYEQANKLLYNKFPNALVFGSFKPSNGWLFRNGEEQLEPEVEFHDKPYWTWANAIVMDIGDSSYAGFMLSQAKRHIEKLPEMDGICIDRMDWLGEYNWKGDDGISWVGGKPVRALTNSWKSFLAKLGRLMHNSNKAIFCNPHIHRIDLMGNIDGIFNEGGFEWDKMNLSSFLCFYKPLIIWTQQGEMIDSAGSKYFKYQTWNKKIIRERPDDYLQRLIYMGAFPMAPFPGNDHSIQPDTAFERYFNDYGTMLSNLKNRRWILEHRAISVDDNAALANIFATPGKYIIPVIYGKEKEAVIRVHLHSLIQQAKTIRAKVIYPGTPNESDIAADINGQDVVIKVPLVRGCAMVVLN